MVYASYFCNFTLIFQKKKVNKGPQPKKGLCTQSYPTPASGEATIQPQGKGAFPYLEEASVTS